MSDSNYKERMTEILRCYRELKKTSKENKEELDELYKEYMKLWLPLKKQEKALWMLKSVDVFEAYPFLEMFATKIEGVLPADEEKLIEEARSLLREVLSFNQTNSDGMKTKVAFHVLAVSLKNRGAYDVFVAPIVNRLPEMLNVNNNTYDIYKRFFLKHLEADIDYPDLIKEFGITPHTLNSFMKKMAGFDSYQKMDKKLIPIRETLNKWIINSLNALNDSCGIIDSPRGTLIVECNSIAEKKANGSERDETAVVTGKLEASVLETTRDASNRNTDCESLKKKYDELIVKYNFSEKHIKDLHDELEILQTVKADLTGKLRWHEGELTKTKAELERANANIATLIKELEQQVAFTQTVQNEKASQTEGAMAKIAQKIKNDYILLEGFEEAEMSQDIGEMLREELVKIAEYFEKEGYTVR